VGFEAMRMGSIMYFVPFFFVLNPALILQGPAWEVVVVTGTAVIGIACIGAALQGYLLGMGRIESTVLGWATRAVLMAAGLFFAVPGGTRVGLGHLELTLIALALLAVSLGLFRLQRPPALNLQTINREVT
jgi:TRAP-type uncharacterized transport system fused permease subunit